MSGCLQLIAKSFASSFSYPHPLAMEKPEQHHMKRLSEWINLIAAVIRLINVISRTGWF